MHKRHSWIIGFLIFFVFIFVFNQKTKSQDNWNINIVTWDKFPAFEWIRAKEIFIGSKIQVPKEDEIVLLFAE